MLAIAMYCVDLDGRYDMPYGPVTPVFIPPLLEPLLSPDPLPEMEHGCSMWHSIRCFFDAPRQLIVNKLK